VAKRSSAFIVECTSSFSGTVIIGSYFISSSPVSTDTKRDNLRYTGPTLPLYFLTNTTGYSASTQSPPTTVAPDRFRPANTSSRLNLSRSTEF
jgi:hypothetical protein